MPASQILMEIGDRLREHRERMGLTQKEAARLLGISETFYGEIERGNKRLPIERMILLREKMGADLTYILTGDRFTPMFMVEICKQCPKDKQELMENMLRKMAELYK